MPDIHTKEYVHAHTVFVLMQLVIQDKRVQTCEEVCAASLQTTELSVSTLQSFTDDQRVSQHKHHIK